MKKLELYDVSELEKKSKNVCVFARRERVHPDIKQIRVTRDRVGR
jgi:hypothetical protein